MSSACWIFSSRPQEQTKLELLRLTDVPVVDRNKCVLIGLVSWNQGNEKGISVGLILTILDCVEVRVSWTG